jgi:hypothetical protein
LLPCGLRVFDALVSRVPFRLLSFTPPRFGFLRTPAINLP